MYEERRGGHNKTHESTEDFDYIDSFWTLGEIANQLYVSRTKFNLNDLSIEYVNRPFGGQPVKYFYCPVCEKRVRHLYIYYFTRFVHYPEDFELKCRNSGVVSKLVSKTTSQKPCEGFLRRAKAVKDSACFCSL